MKILKKFFKRKTPDEKKAERLLKENNCVCYCKECHAVIEYSEDTDCEGVYKFTCSKCNHVGYFDYCHPAPIYLSEDKFLRLRDFGVWDPVVSIPRVFEVQIPEGFKNIRISSDYKYLTADGNSNTLKIPLFGKYKKKSVEGKIVKLERIL